MHHLEKSLGHLRRSRGVQAIVGIGVAGWLLRLWAVLVYRPTCGTGAPDCYTLAGDAKYIHDQANVLAATGRFLNPLIYNADLDAGLVPRRFDDAGDPPLFASYLAGWSKLGLDGITDHRVLATLWGFALVIVVGLFARRLAGDVAGTVAAVIAAVHPLLWVNDIMLMSEGMYQPFVVVVMWVAHEWTRAPSRRRAIGLGVAIALAALVRAEAVVLFVFLVPPLIGWARELEWRERISQIVWCGMAGALVMAPWLVYNNLRFERLTTLTSGSGTVLMAGACDEAWSGESMGFWALCFTNRNLQVDLEAELPGAWRAYGDPEKVIYDASVIDAFNRDKALEYYRDHWTRYPAVALARMGRTLEVFRVRHSLRMNWQVEGRWKTPSTIGLGMYYALVPFTVLGALALRRRGIRLTPLLAVWPMVLFASATTFGLTRYRVPIDLAMVVLAGVAVGTWWQQRQPDATGADDVEGAGAGHPPAPVGTGTATT